MLRITSRSSPTHTLLIVDGELTVDAVHELRRVCDAAVKPLVLNLGDLLRADDSGCALLTELKRAGAQLLNLSPYLALRMKSPAGGAEASA